MQKKLPKMVLAAAVGMLSLAPFAMAREGDRSIREIQMSDLPEAVRGVVKKNFEAGAEDGRVYRIDNANGEQFAATFRRGDENMILRVGADGKVIEEARAQGEGDRTFLATAGTEGADKSTASARGGDEQADKKAMDDDTKTAEERAAARKRYADRRARAAATQKASEEDIEVQLASAMEEAEKRTPVGENELPEAARDKAADELKGATHVGRYRLEDGNFLIHYRTPDGQMKEMTLSDEGEFVEKPRQRELLNLAMQIRKDDVPKEVMQTIDRELADAKIENPERARYFRVGEDDYSIQFDTGDKRMGLRVDADGSVVTPLRESNASRARNRDQEIAPGAN